MVDVDLEVEVEVEVEREVQVEVEVEVFRCTSETISRCTSETFLRCTSEAHATLYNGLVVGSRHPTELRLDSQAAELFPGATLPTSDHRSTAARVVRQFPSSPRGTDHFIPGGIAIYLVLPKPGAHKGRLKMFEARHLYLAPRAPCSCSTSANLRIQKWV